MAGQNTTEQTQTSADRVRSILLVYDAWADGSSWSKEIPILKDAGYNVTVVQLALHSMVDDVATVKHGVELQNGSTLLVGHSYGGFL